ncbi:hypothetical protein MG293_013276 [Ovis ammon polii]|uniref:Uncharacterized protein n=1 Tax=Ovis ammon polii TaxID=230172 RepID=A0AAD4Y7C3_OVIAM|nr:hypothetical protein MG293_013276 [Ovis ammon polii]
MFTALYRTSDRLIDPAQQKRDFPYSFELYHVSLNILLAAPSHERLLLMSIRRFQYLRPDILSFVLKSYSSALQAGFIPNRTTNVHSVEDGRNTPVAVNLLIQKENNGCCVNTDTYGKVLCEYNFCCDLQDKDISLFIVLNGSLT